MPGLGCMLCEHPRNSSGSGLMEPPTPQEASSGTTEPPAPRSPPPSASPSPTSRFQEMQPGGSSAPVPPSCLSSASTRLPSRSDHPWRRPSKAASATPPDSPGPQNLPPFLACPGQSWTQSPTCGFC